MRFKAHRLWWLALAASAVLGLWRLRFDAEVLSLLPDRLPAVHGLQLYQRHFANERELTISLRGPTAETAEAAAQVLAEGLRQRTDLAASVLWRPPWLDRPEDVPELIACLWLNQPPEELARLAGSLVLEKLPARLEQARERLATSLSPLEIGQSSYDPLGLTQLPSGRTGGNPLLTAQRDWFASPDGTYRVVYLEARTGLAGYRACVAWMGSVEAAVNRCRDSAAWPAGVTVRYTGAPAFVAQIASGMERDLRGSVAATLALIVALFWWAHRSGWPLVWLVAMLLLSVLGALVAGGLVFGKLNAISLGFAAVLLGLGVDYGLVIYQEAVYSPGSSVEEVRQAVGPSVQWSALTTAAAFGLLNFAGLPGLSQLGSLVAAGLLLAAGAMLYGYLPIVVRWRSARAPADAAALRTGAACPAPEPAGRLPRALTVALAGAAAVALALAWPQIDRTNQALQPRDCPAQAALEEFQHELSREGDPLLVVVAGETVQEVARRLDLAGAHFARAETRGELQSHLLPSGLWPHPAWQRANLATVRRLLPEAAALRQAVLRAGFTTNALALADGLFDRWREQAARAGPVWPGNPSCAWTLKHAVARDGTRWLAAGTASPAPGATADTLAGLDPALPGVWVTGWAWLGESLLRHVEPRVVWLAVVMVLTLAGGLWLAFGRWREVLLSLATLAFSLAALQAIMGLAGWRWNLMNLTALPLLLGAGVDYSIHVQSALRRTGGSVRAMRRATGRAVFLCAATSVVGFGSNALSGNPGLASLGRVCALGLALAYLASVFLLPAWWRLFESPGAGERAVEGAAGPGKAPAGGAHPPALYRASLWRLGMLLVRILPAPVLDGLCSAAAAAHYRLHPRRRRIVVQNLRPVLSGDERAARRMTRRLYRRFAGKMADLLRLESGRADCRWIADLRQRETILTAHARGRGVLLVTLHLGNWEHGGLLLTGMGMKLTLLTLAEPEGELTRLRIESRARWGIETLVIGEGGFAFVEVIRRLQAGAAVAISIDRPPRQHAVEVELFGRPFLASPAAAELARASGCAVLGVTIVREAGAYAVRVLPEFAYDRPGLGAREARREFTQQILRAFEPEIRQHPDQWYQFVPVWPEPAKA